jgi:hypothetical protein
MRYERNSKYFLRRKFKRKNFKIIPKMKQGNEKKNLEKNIKSKAKK